MSNTPNAKKTMLVIWFIASLLWAGFCSYMFKIGDIAHAYRAHETFAEKIARGRGADPYRWEYNLRGYERTARMVEKANKDLGLFVLLGFGFPGLMLAVGTAVMQQSGKGRRKAGKAA